MTINRIIKSIITSYTQYVHNIILLCNSFNFRNKLGNAFL